MSSSQVKLFKLLFGLFLFILGLWLPHKPLSVTPAPLTAILGAQTETAQITSLIVQPEAGVLPLTEKINRARENVDVAIYLLSDPAVVDALVRAKERGVRVRVLLENAPYGGGSINQKSRATLLKAGMAVQDPPENFALLHQKTLIIDREEVFLLTFNLTRAAFTRNRGFGVTIRSPPDVAEIQALFDADWNHTIHQPKIAHLVISPDNARLKILSLLNEAVQQLKVAVEVLEDPETIELLKKKAASVSVQILLANPQKIAPNQKAAEALGQNRVAVKFLLSPYLHAKLILSDGNYAYLGSVNLTRQSLDQNRELGVIIQDREIIQTLTDRFTRDWQLAVER